jgi:hypothetical protein
LKILPVTTLTGNWMGITLLPVIALPKLINTKK